MTTTQTTHTPGPWEAKYQPFAPSHTIGKRAPNGSLDLIADLRESVPKGEEREANARLIAAAPMGYALAQHLLALADDAYLMGHPEWEALIDEAKNYIAQAEGRPTP